MLNNNNVENHNVDIGTHMSHRNNMWHTKEKLAQMRLCTCISLTLA